MTTLFYAVLYYIDTLVPLDLIHQSRLLSIFTQRLTKTIIAIFSLLILFLKRHANDEI